MAWLWVFRKALQNVPVRSDAPPHWFWLVICRTRKGAASTPHLARSLVSPDRFLKPPTFSNYLPAKHSPQNCITIVKEITNIRYVVIQHNIELPCMWRRQISALEEKKETQKVQLLWGNICNVHALYELFSCPSFTRQWWSLFWMGYGGRRGCCHWLTQEYPIIAKNVKIGANLFHDSKN